MYEYVIAVVTGPGPVVPVVTVDERIGLELNRRWRLSKKGGGDFGFPGSPAWGDIAAALLDLTQIVSKCQIERLAPLLADWLCHMPAAYTIPLDVIVLWVAERQHLIAGRGDNASKN